MIIISFLIMINTNDIFTELEELQFIDYICYNK